MQVPGMRESAEQPTDPPATGPFEASEGSQQDGVGGEDGSHPGPGTEDPVSASADTASPVEDKPSREWRWPEVLMAVGGAATVIIAGAGIYFGVAQLKEADRLQKETNRLQRAQLDSHLEEVMMNLDRYFASHPELRPFFFAIGHRERYPPKGPLLAPAMGTAEMVIDFADDVGAYAAMRKMKPSDSARWRRIVSSYFKESPVMRFMWKKLHHAYRASTACILQAPIQREKLRDWDWRTNSPSEAARRCS